MMSHMETSIVFGDTNILWITFQFYIVAPNLQIFMTKTKKNEKSNDLIVKKFSIFVSRVG